MIIDDVSGELQNVSSFKSNVVRLLGSDSNRHWHQSRSNPPFWSSKNQSEKLFCLKTYHPNVVNQTTCCYCIFMFYLARPICKFSFTRILPCCSMCLNIDLYSILVKYNPRNLLYCVVYIIFYFSVIHFANHIYSLYLSHFVYTNYVSHYTQSLLFSS